MRLLASVVYQSDFINTTAMSTGDHPFNSIPLLQEPELLLRLKDKVTTEKTDNMCHTTGVPPHVEQMRLQKSLL